MLNLAETPAAWRCPPPSIFKPRPSSVHTRLCSLPLANSCWYLLEGFGNEPGVSEGSEILSARQLLERSKVRRSMMARDSAAHPLNAFV